MKSFFASITIALTVLCAPLALAGVVSAAAPQPSPTDAAKNAVCAGVQGQVSGASCAAGTTNLSSIIKTVINVLSIIAGLAGVVMIIVGGLKFITSGGDTSNVATAKKTITYAVIGLVVVALAQFIVRFVLKNAK